MNITSATFAYPQVNGGVRAALADRLDAAACLPGTFHLATCLRLEVAVEGGFDDLQRALDALFDGSPEVAAAKVRSGSDAVVHMFRVAAGLESPVVGEREILTQFRQAVATATEAGRVSGMMTKLLETAIATGRQAREVLPFSPHDSMAAVAAQAVGAAGRVAVLGSGLMAKAIVSGLLGLPAPPDVTVVARTPESVIHSGVDVWSFDRAVEALTEFDAVVSATSAQGRLLPPEELTAILAGRRRPLTLIDMAMPPDFTPPASSPVLYLDIDALARMADRRPRADEADALVHEVANETHRRLAEHDEVGPVIGSLMAMADGVVDRTVDRFAGRLTASADRDLLRQTAHTVARSLLAGPVSYVKDPERAPEAIDVIAGAFGVADD